MGLRFRKSINLGKLFRLNLSKSGIGHSWGIKGFRTTRTATGKKRNTFSVPGTGISYVTETGKNKLKENTKSTKNNEEIKGAKMKKKKKFAPILIGLLVLAGIGSLGNDSEEPKKEPTEIQSLVNNIDNDVESSVETEPEIEASKPESPPTPTVVAPIIANTQQQEETSEPAADEPKPDEQLTAVIAAPIITGTQDQAVVEQPVTEQPTAEEIIVYITNTGAKYHRSGCRHLNDSKYETTLTKALSQGYTACGTCNPPSQ